MKTVKFLQWLIVSAVVGFAFVVGDYHRAALTEDVCASTDHAVIHLPHGDYYCFTREQLIDVIRGAIAAYGQHAPGGGV